MPITNNVRAYIGDATVMTAEGVRVRMTGEMDLCAAAVFRILGKEVATVDEFVMEVSLGQKWFAPSEAKTLLEVLRKSGSVEVRDGYVRPAPRLSEVEVPLAYRPAKEILSAAPAEKDAEPKAVKKGPGAERKEGQDPFPALVAAATEAGVQRREFIQESNRISRELDIDISAAALIALRDAGVDIGPHVGRVRAWISGVTPS